MLKETPLAADWRELLEETVYSGGEWELNCISTPTPSAMTNVNYTFLAKGVVYTGARPLEETEDIDILLLNYDELKSMVQDGRIREGLMLAPLWKYIAENG